MVVLLDFVDKGARPPVPETAPADLVDLVKRAWAQEPDARPSFAEIKALLGGRGLDDYGEK